MGSVGIRANRCALCGRGITGTPVRRGDVPVHLACSIRADEQQRRIDKAASK